MSIYSKLHPGRLCAALAVCAALLTAPSRSAAGDLAATRYADPKGFFQLVPPAGWKVQEFPQDVRGKVAFSAPATNVDLRILVNSVDFSTLDALMSSLQEIERRTGLSTHIERTNLAGRPAVKRWFETKGMRCSVLDFLEGKVDHNLQYCAPAPSYDTHLAVVQKSMETYEAISRTLSEGEAREHFLAKKRRLARLMLDNGSKHVAMAYVKEGLEVSATDPELLKIKEQIEKR